MADGLRDGSAWLANKMVAAQERASDWAGPAKEEANVHPVSNPHRHAHLERTVVATD